MCTVSFIPIDKGFIITSNRDEKINRPTVPPKVYYNNDAKLIYPKDEVSGGTWIVTKDNNTCVVLLNGAFLNHTKKENYSKSRGIVLMEIINAQSQILHFQNINLNNVEPFTIIILKDNTLTEVKWDGTQKHVFPKSIQKPHIWSSATLYTRSQKNKRKQWFNDFCIHNNPLSTNEMMSFHSNTQKSNKEYGLIIKRNGNIKTVSITQVYIKNNNVEMTYIDLINNIITEKIGF